MNFELLDIITLSISLGSALLSAGVLFFHIKRVKKHYEWEKKSRALSYSLTKNEKIKNSRLKVDTVFELYKESKKIDFDSIVEKAKLKNNEDIYVSISDLLGHWENMALAIDLDIVNDEVAFQMVGTRVIRYAYLFQDFIRNRRVSEGNPRAYVHLESIIKSWQPRLKDNESVKYYDIEFS